MNDFNIVVKYSIYELNKIRIRMNIKVEFGFGSIQKLNSDSDQYKSGIRIRIKGIRIRINIKVEFGFVSI